MNPNTQNNMDIGLCEKKYSKFTILPQLLLSFLSNWNNRTQYLRFQEAKAITIIIIIVYNF